MVTFDTFFLAFLIKHKLVKRKRVNNNSALFVCVLVVQATLYNLFCLRLFVVHK